MNIENYLKRAEMYLQEYKPKEANKYLEKVLDENIEISYAWFLKELIDLNLAKEKMLLTYEERDISNDENFVKALKYANQEEEKIYNHYANVIKENIYRSKSKIEKLLQSGYSDVALKRINVILNSFPEDAETWMLKEVIELGYVNEEALIADCDKDIQNDEALKNALKYGDDNLKERIKKIIEITSNRSAISNKRILMQLTSDFVSSLNNNTLELALNISKQINCIDKNALAGCLASVPNASVLIKEAKYVKECEEAQKIYNNEIIRKKELEGEARQIRERMRKDEAFYDDEKRLSEINSELLFLPITYSGGRNIDLSSVYAQFNLKKMEVYDKLNKYIENNEKTIEFNECVSQVLFDYFVPDYRKEEINYKDYYVFSSDKREEKIEETKAKLEAQKKQQRNNKISVIITSIIIALIILTFTIIIILF